MNGKGAGGFVPQITDESVEVLLKLKGLLDRGVLTQEEYDSKKKEIMSGITESDELIQKSTEAETLKTDGKESDLEIVDDEKPTLEVESSAGEQIEESAIAASNTMYCPNCDHVLPAEAASFCQYCGAPLSGQAPAGGQNAGSLEQVDNPKGKKKRTIALVCAILAVGVAIAVLAVTSPFSNTQTSGQSSSGETTETTEQKLTKEEAYYVGTWNAVTVEYDGVSMSPEEVELEFVMVFREDHTLTAETNGEDDGIGEWSVTADGIDITDGTGAHMTGVLQGNQLVMDFGDGFFIKLEKE